MCKNGGLGCELVEGRKFEASKAALIELLIGELIEDYPKNAGPGRSLSVWLGGVQRGNWIEVAGLRGAPDQLPEDEQTAEREEAEYGSDRRLHPLEEGHELLPSNRGSDEKDKRSKSDEKAQPTRNSSVGEFGVGMEEDRRQDEKEGRPDDDAQRSRLPNLQ